MSLPPECRWRNVPLVTPTKVIVGGKVLVGEQAVIDCNGNLVAIFGTEAVATVVVLAHNAGTEGALESLGRAQLLNHLVEVQTKLFKLQAKQPPIAHPPKAIKLDGLPPAPEAKAKAKDGVKPHIHTLVNGATAWTTGARVRSYIPMITADGYTFWQNRSRRAFSKPTGFGSERLTSFDTVSVEKSS